MMKKLTVKVVKDFDPKPYGRTRDDGEASGAEFRERILVPALEKNDAVHVDLTGYNRYGRSFLDEAFGGLIRENGYTYQSLMSKLTYSHDLVKSIELVIEDRLQAAEKARKY